MKLFHSCRKAAELITQARDEQLSWLDRLSLRMHLAMCRNCRNVNSQIEHIGDLVRELLDDEHSEPGRAGRQARPERDAAAGRRR